MVRDLWRFLYLAAPLLPAAVAQGVAFKYDLMKRWKKPLDGGRTFQGKRLFGDNKTWRGLILNLLGCLFGTVVQALLQRFEAAPAELPLIDYEKQGPLLGLLMGLGMTFGELPNSFLKRRMGIGPGQQARGPKRVFFFLFDQLDLALGVWLFIFCLVRPSWGFFFLSLFMTLMLHVAVSVSGYLLGMRKTWV